MFEEWGFQERTNRILELVATLLKDIQRDVEKIYKKLDPDAPPKDHRSRRRRRRHRHRTQQ
jgi:Txe/YoeB family toxin of Txe-Axe toxin-antitoxin module